MSNETLCEWMNFESDYHELDTKDALLVMQEIIELKLELLERKEDLDIIIDNSKNYSSVQKQEKVRGESYDWKLLNKYSVDKGIHIGRAFLDPVICNSYRADVWKEVFNVDVSDSKVKTGLNRLNRWSGEL